MKPTSTLIWIDDERDPSNLYHFSRYKQLYSNVGIDVIWMEKYSEFVDYVSKNGISDHVSVSFDHDLGEEQTLCNKTVLAKTGYDCAKFLVEYCMDNDIDLPTYYVHSANPVGVANINGLFESYTKFRNR